MRPARDVRVLVVLKYLHDELQADQHPLAHVPRQLLQWLNDPVGDGCRRCGGPVEPVRIGRPRVTCEACRPPRRKPTPKSDQILE